MLLLASPAHAQFFEAVCSPSRDRLIKNQLDCIFMQQQYLQFKAMPESMIRVGVRSSDARIRSAALAAAGDRKLSMRDEFVARLTDESQLVRQVARRNLVLLTRRDFGPMPCCTKEEAAASQELWRAWFEEPYR
jgi:hypothetical protein